MKTNVWSQWLKRRDDLNNKKDRNRYEKNRFDRGATGGGTGALGTTSTDVSRSASAPGTSGNVSRQDHTHIDIFPQTVTALPAIPTDAMLEVFWATPGDNQIWRAAPGQSFWTPTQILTTLSGTP